MGVSVLRLWSALDVSPLNLVCVTGRVFKCPRLLGSCKKLKRFSICTISLSGRLDLESVQILMIEFVFLLQRLQILRDLGILHHHGFIPSYGWLDICGFVRHHLWHQSAIAIAAHWCKWCKFGAFWFQVRRYEEEARNCWCRALPVVVQTNVKNGKRWSCSIFE